MRQGRVYNNNIIAGTIIETDERQFIFEYDNMYFEDNLMPSICLHLPKTQKQFTSKNLFPFFYNLTSEGANKKIQSLQLKIDENDAFGFLLKTAAHETIGAIRVEEITQ
jgi:HipA-like protein